jgi:dUTP pyrophosphatase
MRNGDDYIVYSGPLPENHTSESTGYDVSSSEDLVIEKGSYSLVKTGIRFHYIPKNFDIQVRSRSGLALKYGIFVLNGVGTIDPDYRGELCVILANFGKEDFKIRTGDRIAQLVFAEAFHPKFKHEKTEHALHRESERGEGGFGSTGT